MQKLQDMFVGNEIRFGTFTAKVLDINEAGWVLEITYDSNCRDNRYYEGNIVFFAHAHISGVRLRK
jgi:hypothetical protein